MHIQFNCILVIHLQYIHKKGTVINKLKLTHSNVKSDCRSAPVKPSCLLNVHLWQKKKTKQKQGDGQSQHYCKISRISVK